LVHLVSNETSLGSLWAEGTLLDAATCHADIEGFPLALSKTIDAESPSESWFSEGQVLCMRTSDERIVVGELTLVAASTDASPGVQATFRLALWANE
jgi:hypothetical protein